MIFLRVCSFVLAMCRAIHSFSFKKYKFSSERIRNSAGYYDMYLKTNNSVLCSVQLQKENTYQEITESPQNISSCVYRYSEVDE